MARIMINRGRMLAAMTLFAASAANFGDPLLCLVLDFVSALTLIIGDIDVYASNFCIASNESHHKNMLKST